MNNQENLYDTAIVGSGPASFSASIYASRYKLKNVIFGKVPGGTITEAHLVCNYPGHEDISGMELSMKFLEHAKNKGGEYLTESIADIKKEGDVFKLIAESGNEYFAKTVILATGTDRNKLAIPGEDNYVGKGLSYCATCDAMFYKNKVVAVIGGSNAATMAGNMLSGIASKVYIIYRGTELRGEPVWVDQLNEKDNVEVLYQTVVTGLEGESRLERIKLSKEYNSSDFLDIDGVFVEIGSEPNIVLPEKLDLEVDAHHYIVVDKEQKTSVEGIWAAGDCTTNSNGFKQVVTAVSEGAIAGNSVFMYLQERS